MDQKICFYRANGALISLMATLWAFRKQKKESNGFMHIYVGLLECQDESDHLPSHTPNPRLRANRLSGCGSV